MPFPGRLFRTTSTDPPQAAPRPVAGIESRLGSPTARGLLLGHGAKRRSQVFACSTSRTCSPGHSGRASWATLAPRSSKITAASRGGGANTPDHPYYIMWNRNKRNVSLNMAMPRRGRRIARKLAEHSDVIIENFSAGVLAGAGGSTARVARAR